MRTCVCVRARACVCVFVFACVQVRSCLCNSRRVIHRLKHAGVRARAWLGGRWVFVRVSHDAIIFAERLTREKAVEENDGSGDRQLHIIDAGSGGDCRAFPLGPVAALAGLDQVHTRAPAGS